LCTVGPASAAEADLSQVPGVVVDHCPAASGVYVGSPSLAILADGSYVASHDLFGPKSNERVRAVTRVFRSAAHEVYVRRCRIARVSASFVNSVANTHVNGGILSRCQYP